MSLEQNKNINITGESKIDGVVAERYTASIDETNPEKMNISRMVINQQLRKDNREQCRQDMAEFEDDAYAQQDELLSTGGKVSEDQVFATNEEDS